MTIHSPRAGILPYQDIKRLIASRAISASPTIEERQIQPASLDLRLGRKAYRLISSFLPELSAISSRLNVLDFYQSDLVMYEMDLTDGAILEKGHVYLVPLLEQLALPKTIRARANPKSTTGRLDVFTRVVTDLTSGFDEIRAGYRGRPDVGDGLVQQLAWLESTRTEAPAHQRAQETNGLRWSGSERLGRRR